MRHKDVLERVLAGNTATVAPLNFRRSAKLKQAAPAHPCARGIPFILNISPGKTIRIPSAPIRADTSTQVSRITRLTSPGMALPLFASAVGGYNAALPGRIGRDLILRKL